MLSELGLNREALSKYALSDPVLRAQWENAREASADSFYDEALELARDKTADPQQVRVHVDTLKWAARIRNPRTYGDKAQLDVNVRTVDLTRIIQDANARLAAQQAGRVIDNRSGQSTDATCAQALTLLPADLAALL